MAQRIQFQESELRLLNGLLGHLEVSGTEHDLVHDKSPQVQLEISEDRERAQKKILRALRKERNQHPSLDNE